MLSSILSVIALGLIATSSASALNVRAAKATSATGATNTAIATSVAATFPQFGPEKDITGTLTFTPAVGGIGVVITSTGDTALHNFPKGLGPFLYHGIHVISYRD